jgi:lipoprotein signal peptidase
MKQFSLKEYLPSKLFLFLVPILLFVNYGISYLAKYLEIVGVKNTLPFSLNIESDYLYGLFGLIVVFLLATKLLNKHPLSTSFIVAGALYNLLERSIYGHVFDFIKITWGFINLADLMLWFGLILLNYEVWFSTEDEFAPIAYASVVESKIIEDEINPTANINPAQNTKALSSPQVTTPTVTSPTIAQAQQPLTKTQEVNVEDSKHDILKSLRTSKIKTVTDQLNKVRSSDSQEIFVPKMDYKPKKVVTPRIKVT